MANKVAQNPMFLDTVATITTHPYKIHHMEFVQYALDTDTAVVQDAYGNTVWAANGAADLQEVRSGTIGWIDGLRLNSITAGAVLVYFA